MAKYSRAQKQLIKEQVSSLTLENPQVSISKAVLFMKKLTVVAISSITYLRNIFPADSFIEKKWDEQRVYILQGTKNVPGSKSLMEWIKSAFELVHSHHLKKMILVIQSKNTTLEMYTFSFTYNHEAIHCDVIGEIDGIEVVMEQSQGVPKDIAKSVRQLLRAILVHTTTLEPLPLDCELSLKLLVDDDTPEEVLPQGFLAGPDDLLNFPIEVETLKLGKVETRFATFAVSTKSALLGGTYTYSAENQEENTASQIDDVNAVPVCQGDAKQMASLSPNIAQLEDEDEVPCSQVESFRISLASIRSPMSDPDEHDNLMVSDYQLESPRMDKISQSDNNDAIALDNKAAEHDSTTTTLSKRMSVVSLNKEKTVRCICERDDLFDDTIECTSCATLQHKTCYKLLDCHQVRAHVCIMCHNPSQGKSCSVPELLNDVNRKEKENVEPDSFPQPKRRKILKTSHNLKSSRPIYNCF